MGYVEDSAPPILLIMHRGRNISNSYVETVEKYRQGPAKVLARPPEEGSVSWQSRKLLKISFDVLYLKYPLMPKKLNPAGVSMDSKNQGEPCESTRVLRKPQRSTVNYMQEEKAMRTQDV